MKEAYFTPSTIEIKAQAMLHSLEGLKSNPSQNFIPQHSALLVLDLQAYFLSPASHAFIPSAPAILLGVNGLIEAYTKHSLPIIFTRHLNSSQDAGLMATWWHDLIQIENPMSELDDQVNHAMGTVIFKHRYDAFFETNLEQLLREKAISQVVICGVMAHLCCETTARSAFMRGFEVFFTIDGTATYNEAFHRATLLNLAHGFAVPVLVKYLLETIEK
jgi:bifunctional isochorismate lyase/aryl carrier protein